MDKNRSGSKMASRRLALFLMIVFMNSLVPAYNQPAKAALSTDTSLPQFKAQTSFDGDQSLRSPQLDAQVEGPQSGSDIRYIYDALGRLKAVVDPATNTGIYNYDAVGNVTSIARQSSAQLSILQVEPTSGPVGTAVTIYGTAFSSNPLSNTVKFNGVATTVISATTTQLITRVPSGSRTGSITVANTAGTATSPTAFTVGASPAPVISGFAPAIADRRSTLTINGSFVEKTLVNNVLRLNGLISPPTIVSNTSMSTVVLTGTTSGRISLSTPYGQVVSSADLFVPPTPYMATDVGVTGRLALGTSKNITFTTTGKIGLLLFDGTAGQHAALQINNSTISQADMSVLAPDGSRVGDITWFGTSPTLIDAGILPTSGTYTLLVHPYSGFAGSARITLNSFADVADTITSGTAKSLSLTLPGQNARLTFSGTAGQIVSAQVNSSTVSYGSLSLLNSDGVQVGASTPFDSLGGFLDGTALPVAGTYTMLVDAYASYTGTVNLTLRSFTDVTSAITPGTAKSLALTVPGQNARLTFSGTAGQVVSVQASSATITDSRLYLLDSSGRQVGYPGSFSNPDGFLDGITLLAAATYTLVVDPSSSYTGNVTLTLRAFADVTSTIAPGTAKSVSLTIPGQKAYLSFNGTGGRVAVAQISNSTISYGSFYLQTPAGGQLGDPDFFGVSGGSLDSRTLPVTGVYNLVIDPYGSYTGSVTVTLSVASGVSAPKDSGNPGNSSAKVTTYPPLSGAASSSAAAEGTGAPRTKNDAARNYRPSAPAEWIPDGAEAQDNWRVDGVASPWQALPALQADLGVTGLAGQVLRLDGQPLAGVTLRIKDCTVRTDENGQFLLTGAAPGHWQLTIDGRSANKGANTYGLFVAGVDLRARVTTVLPYIIWMPVLDTRHAVKITSPTTTDVVVTTPYIPGLELRIPKGTTIRDSEGKPVTEIGITAIPLDRPPYPLPGFENIPIYFTIQPGGAFLSPSGGQIIYPNYTHAPAGSPARFWFYDPAYGGERGGWTIYGGGEVSADGKQVVPDEKTRIYETTGAMFSWDRRPPSTYQPCGECSQGGDPVDLSTGLFSLEETDLVLPDIMPLAPTRTYRPNDNVSRAFGLGTTMSYDLYLWNVSGGYQDVYLIMPNGSRVRYVRISPGTGYIDAIFESTATPTSFYKSTIRWNGNGWDLRLDDSTVYVFGFNAPLQAMRDRYGNTISFMRSSPDGTLSPNGNITQLRSPNGRWIKLTYDSANRISAMQDNVGRVVGYTYDTGGRLWKATDPAGGVTEYSYDSAGRMLSIKNPRGIVYVTNEYDSKGRVIRQTHADGGIYTFTYTLDTHGKVTQTLIIDPLGHKRLVTFNADGYTTTDTAAYGTSLAQRTSYARLSGSNLVANIVDALGRRTTFAYDAYGKVTGVTHLAGTSNAVSELITYEAAFHLPATSTDPLGNVTRYVYDSFGNLTSLTDPLGHTTTFAYASNNQPLSITDPLGNVTQFGYDFGDLASVNDPVARRSRFFTDAAGRSTITIDPIGNTSRVVFDVLGRPVQNINALSGVTRLGYDANGNVTSVTDARGNVTSYTYDLLDRRISRVDPLGKLETSSYDLSGNLVQQHDRNGQITRFNYDALDRPVTVTYSDASTISNTYDQGNRILRTVDSLGGTIQRAYDGLDRLTSETTAQGVVSYSYDTAGRRTSLTVGSQPTVTYAYGPDNRLTALARGTTTATMSYDAAGRATGQRLPNGVNATYSYNAASELTGLTYTRGATTLGTLQYFYDFDGRLAHMAGTLARATVPQALISASYDAANRLRTWGSNTLDYAANGELASDSIKTYIWNARNQLTSVVGGGTIATFTYDALGRRIGKTIDGISTSFLYDGMNAVQELSGSTPVADYFNGLGLDNVLARTDGTGTVVTLKDALGSNLALVDSSGTLTTRYTYEPFGATTAAGAASKNSYQYTGRENDGVGLYYYRARYYSPSLQRFISEDPLGFASGNTNLYAYAQGDPVNLVDPSGLLFRGRINAGEQFGSDAAQYWADQYVASETWYGKAGYGLLGGLASLWTPCTSDSTLATLGAASAAGAISKLYQVPEYLYHFTSAEGGAAINASGVLNAGKGLYGEGVYLTRFTSPTMATLQGARSTEAVIRVATEGLEISPTLFPGTFRTLGTSIILR